MNATKGDIAELVAAVAVVRPLAEAARASGMSVRTAQRRLKEPDVAVAISEARVGLTRQAVDKLGGLRDLAFLRLREILTGGDEPQHLLRAADLVLRHLVAADAVELRENILFLEYEVASLRDHFDRVGGDDDE